MKPVLFATVAIALAGCHQPPAGVEAPSLRETLEQAGYRDILIHDQQVPCEYGPGRAFTAIISDRRVVGLACCRVTDDCELWLTPEPAQVP
jgi:hypothetical protein